VNATRGAIVAEISEHHRLHRHRCPNRRDVLIFRYVIARSLCHESNTAPTAIHSCSRGPADVAPTRDRISAELADQFLQIVDVQVGVVLDPALAFLCR